jgi:hypothetical protein
VNIKRRIPLYILFDEVYRVLSTYQDTCPVYDKVPVKATPPYATLGEFTYKQVGSKDADVGNISLQIHIWSVYNGKSEVNEIADDLTQVLTSYPLDLSKNNFAVNDQDIDMFEAFPDSVEGYHGVLTFIAEVQNLGPK